MCYLVPIGSDKELGGRTGDGKEGADYA